MEIGRNAKIIVPALFFCVACLGCGPAQNFNESNVNPEKSPSAPTVSPVTSFSEAEVTKPESLEGIWLCEITEQKWFLRLLPESTYSLRIVDTKERGRVFVTAGVLENQSADRSSGLFSFQDLNRQLGRLQYTLKPIEKTLLLQPIAKNTVINEKLTCQRPTPS